MKIKLHKQCTMHRRFILKDNFKISHSGEERGAGKHKVAPGCLQAGRGNAGGLVGGLAKGVGNSAKIRKKYFPRSSEIAGISEGSALRSPAMRMGHSGCTRISAIMAVMMALVLAV